MLKLFKKINFELLFQLALPLVGGFLVPLLVRSGTSLSASDTYLDIPPLVFIIVWSVLYLMMGYSAYLIEYEDGEKHLIPYYLSLVFNFLWLPLYFAFDLKILALIDLIILLILVIYIFFKYLKIKKIAGYLLLPYILWLIFAFSLNLSAII